MKKNDIFDKIMQMSILKIFKPFYLKHKMILLYLFFGGIAFFLNFGLFVFIDRVLKINELVNNVICWIVCVLFQFWTNRTWVFEGETYSYKGFIKQIASFFGGRIFTLIIEEIILAIFITWLNLTAMIVKIFAQVVVIVLNYFISKFFVFNKKL